MQEVHGACPHPAKPLGPQMEGTEGALTKEGLRRSEQCRKLLGGVGCSRPEGQPEHTWGCILRRWPLVSLGCFRLNLRLLLFSAALLGSGSPHCGQERSQRFTGPVTCACEQRHAVLQWGHQQGRV